MKKPNLKTDSIKQVELLLTILKSNLEEINQLIAEKEKYYYIGYKPKLDERKMPRIGLDGKPLLRELNPSKGRLKEIQEIINSRILSKILLPPNVRGSIKGSSNIANAAVHLGKKYKFKTDMKRYFPSISYNLVFKMLLNNGFSRKVATLLTHLTTHKHELPQGTPTSSTIANLIFVPHDKLIIQYCQINNITYTRYIDDLVFSCPNDFRDKCSEIIQFILDAGFKVSIGKTKYKAGNMLITGVLTRQNVLDASDLMKDLIADLSIKKSTTDARKIYYRNIRKFN